MIKKFILFLILSNLFSPLIFGRSVNHQEDIWKLLKQVRTSPQMHQNNLPPPYNYLLTQPLLTKAIEHYYQRRSIIQKIYVLNNALNNTYFRSIIMLVDSNKKRNKPWLAQKKQETKRVELAFITINLAALPKQMIKDILHTDIPFGTLLAKYHIEIYTRGRSYFSTQCEEELAELIHCHLKNKLYGRTNTIISTVDKKWLADVVELLP